MTPEQNAILVKKGMDARRTFSAASPWRQPTCSLPKAMRAIPARRRATKPYAVSYMLCQRYGRGCKGDTTSPGWTACSRGKTPRRRVPAALTDMRDTFKEMNGRMARAMGLTRASRQKEQER